MHVHAALGRMWVAMEPKARSEPAMSLVIVQGR